MVFLRAVQAGTIWLTAIMTLVVGTPHFVCRCPNGNVKPFCLASLVGKNSCCCGGSCCSVAPGDDSKAFALHAFPSATVSTKTCCCCKAHQGGARDESRTGNRFEKVGCQKTLAEAAVAVLDSFVKDSVQSLTSHLLVPAPEAALSHYGLGVCDDLLARPYAWPPAPTDLVTVLQRFLI